MKGLPNIPRKPESEARFKVQGVILGGNGVAYKGGAGVRRGGGGLWEDRFENQARGSLAQCMFSNGDLSL